MIDTSIITSSYGSVIKETIQNSIIDISDHEGFTDISEELNIIASGIYGEQIRNAIYNALVKIDNFAVPWVGTQEEYDSMDQHYPSKFYVVIKEE